MNAIMVAAALIAALGAGQAQAQDYPTRAITLVVSTAAGGGNDIMARVIGDRMSQTLGQQIVVENRPGAGGTTATRQIAKSAPDGYTLGLGNTGTLAQGPAFYSNAGYDPVKDFTPIGMIAYAPLAVVVHPSVPANTPAGLIAYSKANPGKLNLASPGAATLTRLSGEMFKQAAGIDWVTVHYKGGPPAVVAKLNKALQEALTSPAVKAKIAAEGAEPIPGTPDDYAKDIASEWAKWSKVVRDAGIKAN